MVNNLDNVMVFACRYAHTRQTGAALMVCKAVIAMRDELSAQAKAQIIEEAENEATCNRDDWLAMIMDLTNG
jgi:hypothetical protein